MKRRYLLPAMAIASLLFLALGNLPRGFALQYTGQARVSLDPIVVDVVASPPVAQPGQSMQLTLQARHQAAIELVPDIAIQLPGGLAVSVQDLPRGAIYNVQSKSIVWSPRLFPKGGGQELNLNLRVDSADIQDAEKDIVVTVAENGQRATAGATVWLGIPPMVGEIQVQQRAAVGQPVHLLADISGPGPMSVNWELSDGRRVDVAEPTLAFAAGTQTLTAIVSNPAGTVRRSASIEVVGDPVAGFQPDDETPGAGQAIKFSSISGGQPPLSISWDFGDGSTSQEANPSHSYASPGSYVVGQIVENAFGRSEAYWSVTVGSPPVSDMSIPASTSVGQEMIGQAFGDGSVLRYTWDMGDGRQRNGETISHRYRRSGDYFVTVTAANDYGETATGHWVRVDPGPSVFYVPFIFMGAGGVVEVTNLSADVAASLQTDNVLPLNQSILELAPLNLPPGTTAAEQLFAYINEVRRQYELAPLNYSPELSGSAQRHSTDKAGSPADPHTGTDGSSAAERLLFHRYPGGYAGEATAWGFSDPREAVQFWLNSDSHRVILLNANINDVGVGYYENYETQNVWHWTADFGVSYGAPAVAQLRLQGPVVGAAVKDSGTTNYAWSWPLPLTSGQYFAVYVGNDTVSELIGTVNAPVYGSRYVLSAPAVEQLALHWPLDGSFLNLDWFVRLEDVRGEVAAESEGRPIFYRQDPETALPLATAIVPTVPPLVTATPQGQPTASPTPIPPTSVPPTVEQPPVIVTSTPQPAP